MGIVIEILADDQVLVRFIPPPRAPPVDRTSTSRSSSRSKCPKCPRTFRTLRGLEAHLNRGHKGGA